MPPTPSRQQDALPGVENLGELLEQLGGISPHRVRLRPAPGTATEQDLLDVLDHTETLCELVDGVLVEKVMGYLEGALALWLGRLLGAFLDQHDLGDLAGADATMRLMPKVVRLPDLSFVRWEKLPGRCLPTEPIPDLTPDLAIEVLSEGNTAREMERKRREYFLSGAELVWLVDPNSRTVTVYTAPDEGVVFTEADTLDGGKVLPGLALPVQRIFQRVPPGRRPGKKKRPPSSRKRKKGDVS
jgi:Uma2 family endonuclease